MNSKPNNSNRLLWFVPKWPLPMQDGARVANVNLMKGLSSLGVAIDLIAVAGENENCDIDEIRRVCGVSDCFVVRREAIGNRFGFRGAIRVLKSFLSRPWIAVTLMPFADQQVSRKIFEILLKGPRDGARWTALVYDGLHPAAHSSQMGIYKKPAGIERVIYRAHNEKQHRRSFYLSDSFSRSKLFSCDDLKILWCEKQPRL
jgi:hypothetical protein